MWASGQQVRSSLGEEPVRVSDANSAPNQEGRESKPGDHSGPGPKRKVVSQDVGWVLGSQDGPLKNSHQPVSPVPDPKTCVGWITEMLCSSDLFRELYNHELN